MAPEAEPTMPLWIWGRSRPGIATLLLGLLGTVGAVTMAPPAGGPRLPSHARVCDAPDPRPLPIRGEDCWHLSEGAAWRVRSSLSAQDALVIRIESTDCTSAERISGRIVAHLPRRYGEVLVYCHPAHGTGSTAVRRVQWTAASGFGGTLEWDPR
jgi:hypothetical protein